MAEISYISKRFSKKSLIIIAHARNFVEDYAAQGLSLTLRQLYYRFVAADLLPNSQKSYKRLGSIVNDARLAGLLDWNAIEDRGRSLRRQSHWSSPAEIIQTCVNQYTIDKWAEQAYRVEVWVEKQALEAVVGRAANRWDVPYFSCKGFTSQSEMWRAAQRFDHYLEDEQQGVIIHLGDHDPSGVDMTRDIFDRLNELFGSDVIVNRIALNMDQIHEYAPPPNPAKISDSRAEGYIKKFGPSSWELDALEPRTLNELIEDAIADYVDMDLYEAACARELDGRAELRKIADRLKTS